MRELIEVLAIEPRFQRVRHIMSENLDAALALVELKGGHVDHGIVARLGRNHCVGIIVDEYSLYEGQHWFSIGRTLYAGNALLYEESDGELVAINDAVFGMLKALHFYGSRAEVEIAINANMIDRPCVAFNGTKYWEFGNEPSTA